MPLAFSGFASAFKTVKPFACNAGTSSVAFAEQFGGDVFHANFQRDFHRGNQADEAEQILRAGLIFHRAAAENDLFLRDEIGVADIMPAVNRRIQFLLQLAPDIKHARAARAEQPFVRVGSEKIHVLHRRRKCAERLDGVEAE